MAVNIHNLIAAINPNVFCDPSVKSKAKEIAKEKGYLAAAETAKPVSIEPFSYDLGHATDPFSKPGLKAPIEKHTLVYDSPSEGLEPIYFWILDIMNDRFQGKVSKLIDNFISSPGSGHFSELGQKTTRMQEEAMKMFGAANTVVKSILNILYDLKEFKLRLDLYDKLKSKDKEIKTNAMLSLKQVWMDTVDVKRGNTSIKGLVQQFNYATIIDAFMAAENEKLDFKGQEMDLNDRVKRILKQRLQEFSSWLKESESELRKRFEIEKIYLKNQVNAVKLYARWVKPYLKAARQLEQNARSSAAVVTAFNTVVFELTLLGEAKYDPADDVTDGVLPKMFKNATKRKYTPLVFVEFSFRSIPQRVGQQYAFGGRAEVTFTSYALNDQELKIFKQELEKDDIGDVMKMIENATSESLEKIQADIEEFTEEKKEKEEKPESDDINPFTSLFSFLKSEKKEEKKEDSKKMKADSENEKIIRSQAIIEARETCYWLFDLYKKAHGMPSHYDPYVAI